VKVGLLLASVLLAWLTYELVEKKIRQARIGCGTLIWPHIGGLIRPHP
jgi:peptidoglycan/LPS O-acetylase OafA/YrhL